MRRGRLCVIYERRDESESGVPGVMDKVVGPGMGVNVDGMGMGRTRRGTGMARMARMAGMVGMVRHVLYIPQLYVRGCERYILYILYCKYINAQYGAVRAVVTGGNGCTTMAGPCPSTLSGVERRRLVVRVSCSCPVPVCGGVSHAIAAAPGLLVIFAFRVPASPTRPLCSGVLGSVVLESE